tara:strand:- start:353 stop:763 length:411 start_codon:yes stop_codon:yes gene_type:complete
VSGLNPLNESHVLGLSRAEKENTMLKVRNPNTGKFMEPTSNNCLDCHIPEEGMVSRVMAKRVHDNDVLFMNNGTEVLVEKVIEFCGGQNAEAMIYIGFENENGDGLNFRGYRPNDRVSIIETPENRKIRRDISRLA